MDREVSALQRARQQYRPEIPAILERGIEQLSVEESGARSRPLESAIRDRFPGSSSAAQLRIVEGSGPGAPRPLRIGVVLSGGQAPGGHNVIVGMFDAMRAFHPGSTLFGFRGGPRGIVTRTYQELTLEELDRHRNTGGFDLIGSGRDKLETDEQLAAARETCRALQLDGLAVIGGDDSNTNAALLAESFLEHGIHTAVVGVPKTIDGDLRGEQIDISFGFDTATRLYSELVGNIARDARSAGKYWHFIRLMGRSASHVTLECALQTRPNVALIGEEVRALGWTLAQVVDHVAAAVVRRSAAGKEYGVCLVPEGLIEFIPEIGTLIGELNTLLHQEQASFDALPGFAEQSAFVAERLSDGSRPVFLSMPGRIRGQLMLDRDSHGNVRVSQIDTEQLLIEQVEARLAERAEAGEYRGNFGHQPHFFGYEGRCAAPTNFDAGYTYALGWLAAVLAAFGKTGYLCSITGLARPLGERQVLGIPLTSLMQMETRKGRPTPVIAKALVDLEGPAFLHFAKHRADWEERDAYLYPGPIQYFGPAEITSQAPRTLQLEQETNR